MAAVAVAVMITTGAGAAWAQAGDDNPGPASPPASPRALGGTSRETIFQAITPCRLVDTRSAGGKFNVGQERSYDVRGTGATFAAQGGLGGGCGIPSAATAVEITVTAVEAGGDGFLRVYPSTAPNATFLNSTNVFNASNTGTVGLCGATGGICLLNSDLRVKDFGSTTHIVIDVQGYYQQQMGAHVTAAGVLQRNSRAVSAVQSSTGTYQVIFDRAINECVFTANVGENTSGTANGYVAIQNYGANNNGVFVQTFNDAGVVADKPFYVTVDC